MPRQVTAQGKQIKYCYQSTTLHWKCKYLQEPFEHTLAQGRSIRSLAGPPHIWPSATLSDSPPCEVLTLLSDSNPDFLDKPLWCFDVQWTQWELLLHGCWACIKSCTTGRSIARKISRRSSREWYLENKSAGFGWAEVDPEFIKIVNEWTIFLFC